MCLGRNKVRKGGWEGEGGGGSEGKAKRWETAKRASLENSGLALKRPGSTIFPRMRVFLFEVKEDEEGRARAPEREEPAEISAATADRVHGLPLDHISKRLVERTRNRGHILPLSPNLPGASRNWLWLPDQGLTSVQMFLLLKRKKKGTQVQRRLWQPCAEKWRPKSPALGTR